MQVKINDVIQKLCSNTKPRCSLNPCCAVGRLIVWCVAPEIVLTSLFCWPMGRVPDASLTIPSQSFSSEPFAVKIINVSLKSESISKPENSHTPTSCRRCQRGAMLNTECHRPLVLSHRHVTGTSVYKPLMEDQTLAVQTWRQVC